MNISKGDNMEIIVNKARKRENRFRWGLGIVFVLAMLLASAISLTAYYSKQEHKEAVFQKEIINQRYALTEKTDLTDSLLLVVSALQLQLDSMNTELEFWKNKKSPKGTKGSSKPKPNTPNGTDIPVEQAPVSLKKPNVVSPNIYQQIDLRLTPKGTIKKTVYLHARSPEDKKMCELIKKDLQERGYFVPEVDTLVNINYKSSVRYFHSKDSVEAKEITANVLNIINKDNKSIKKETFKPKLLKIDAPKNQMEIWLNLKPSSKELRPLPSSEE